jgi:2-keto-4-pentenoate hydratase
MPPRATRLIHDKILFHQAFGCARLLHPFNRGSLSNPTQWDSTLRSRQSSDDDQAMSDQMTLPAPHELERLSVILRSARLNRTAVAPLTTEYPDLDVTHAYRIAQLVAAADIKAGAKIVGHKIGLTSVAVQQQLGVSEPDYGVLLDTGRLKENIPVSARNFIAPRIELELAFKLAEPLCGPGVVASDVWAASEAVCGAIELCDSRIADWKIKLPDTIADGASGAAFLLGSTQARPGDIDLTDVEVSLLSGGKEVVAGNSRAVMGDPCEAVAWLANAVGELGESLDAGEIILSGACTPMVPIARGDHYVARFGSGLGDIDLEVTL